MPKPFNNPNSSKKVLAANEERFRALVIATSDVIYGMSADWETMFELDGHGFVSDTSEPTTDWMSLNVFPDDHENVKLTIKEAIRKKSIFQMEHRVIRPDKTIGWTFSRAVPILDENGEITEWFGAASDISDRKEAEEALIKAKDDTERQKRVLEAITSGTPDLMYVFDLNYRFTYANSALLQMWGKTWDEAIGKGLLENGYEPWHAEMHEREIDQVKATKESIRGEVSFPHATLGRRIYDYIFTPVLNSKGEVEAVAGTTRDVTERKIWEETLEQNSEKLHAVNEEIAASNEEHEASNEELRAANEELALVNQQLIEAQHKIEEGEIALRLAIDAANFGTWYIHSVTREFITDDRLKEFFGYYPNESLSIEQALGQISEDYRGYVAEKLENAISNNGDYDVTYPVTGFHDNKLRWLRAIGNLKAHPSGAFSAFTGVVMEITDQHFAAKKVERAEESLRMAVEAANSGTFSINARTLEFSPSPRMKELFGFHRDEEMPYEACVKRVPEDYRPAIKERVEAAIKRGQRFEQEYPVIGYHDGKQRWLRGVGTLQYGSNGDDDFFVGIVIDITERKAEDQRKNDFIGMVSHELKTPLTSLKAIIQVSNLKLKESDDTFLVGAMTKAHTQVKRMSGMINGFLNISRLESGKMLIDKHNFNLEEMIRELVEEMQLSISNYSIDFESGYSGEIYADWDKINSVITNLISNAVKYSPAGTKIHISSQVNNTEVIISVKDQGIGINPSDFERVFDRYYRIESSKTLHISGFGIGLYLCSEIVKRHGGRIWLESEPELGSTFYFSLPLELNN